VGLYEINPLDDSRFIKNGKTLFDISASFVNTKKQWIDPQLIGGEFAFQPEQLLAGLSSCIRSAEQDPALFDLTTPLHNITSMDPETMQIIDAKMVAPVANQTHTGKPIQPALTITADQNTLVQGTDYTVSYLNNIEVGTAYAVITGQGNWMGTSIKIPFQIVAAPQKTDDKQPQQTNNTGGNQQNQNTQKQDKNATIKLTKPVIKKLVSTKKKTLSISFAKVKNAKKYKIQIATDKKFKKNRKTKTVTSAKKVTFQKLQSGKKYYVRIQAVNGKKQSKSKWSKVKSKKVK
ncbi:MAG: fibronectin type III domain-containing protein, partial [Lachnospiraceae bacterium]|nr:fibronectin type III domain-containing protein [Lachnospiraceae bacterium]